jgi:hypothetical protein
MPSKKQKKQWISFEDGKDVSDDTINIWIGQCIDKILSGENRWSIAYGNTNVSIFKWVSCTEIIVVTNKGYRRIIFYRDEPLKISAIEPYVRG